MVIGVIVVLVAIVIIAVNPSRQLAQARNVQRLNDITAILEAVQQQGIASGGWLPGIDMAWRVIGTAGSGCTIPCGVTTGSTLVTLSATADAWLFQWTPNTNYGTSLDIEIYPWSSPGVNRRGIIRFDLTGVPSTASILSARVFLLEAGTMGFDRTIAFHRVTRSWTEGGVSWNRYDGVNSWTSPGGDYAIVPTATANVVWGGGPLDWDSWDVTADVQAFVSGTLTNDGWLIKDTVEDDSQNFWFFHSREALLPSFRPYLQVDYTVVSGAGGVTAPACLDLSSALIPTYLVTIPQEPQGGTAQRTWYAIRHDSADRLYVRACGAELGEDLMVSR
jgi:hypothetical protein